MVLKYYCNTCLKEGVKGEDENLSTFPLKLKKNSNYIKPIHLDFSLY